MIEVWVIKLNRLLTDAQYNNLLGEVTWEKQQKLAKYRRKEDAQRSLIGEIAIRKMIQDQLGLEKQKIIFEQNAYGKPYLKGVPNFHFNISHSDIYVACAISKNPIGIDIEMIKPIDFGIAKRFFTKAEEQYISEVQSEVRQQNRFYEIWTRKEAYIKLCGKGLHIPLNSFDVLTPAEKVYYKCIYGDDQVICHICAEQKEVVYVKYLTVEKLLSLYVC